MATTQEPVSIAEFLLAVKPLKGMAVRRIRLGYSSALLVEFGRLHTEKWQLKRRAVRKLLETRVVRSVYGQAGLLIEWNWRFERPRSIDVGSSDPLDSLDRCLQKYRSQRIKDIRLEGRLPELVLCFESDLWLRCCNCARGQPGWALFLRDRKRFPLEPRQAQDVSVWFKVNRGKLVREIGFDDSQMSEK
jgi:hypothetical protein